MSGAKLLDKKLLENRPYIQDTDFYFPPPRSRRNVGSWRGLILLLVPA
jgi:hypothetical protein